MTKGGEAPRNDDQNGMCLGMHTYNLFLEPSLAQEFWRPIVKAPAERPA